MQLLTRVFPPIPHIHAISVACPYLVEHAVTSRLSALPPGSQPRLQSVSGTNWTRQQATRRSCPGSEFRNALSSRAQKRAVTAGPFILFVFSSFFSSASECPLRNYVAPNEIVLGTEPAAARCGRATDTVDHHGLNMRETGLTFSFLLACFFPSPLFFLRNRRVLHHRGRGSNHTSSLLAFASLAGSWTIVLYACPKRDSSRTILATFLQLSQTLRNWGFVE